MGVLLLKLALFFLTVERVRIYCWARACRTPTVITLVNVVLFICDY